MKRKRENVLAGILILLVTGLRFIDLKLTPLFGDEATYCFWGQRLSQSGLPSLWEVMVNKGKISPVLPWLQSVGMSLFQSNDAIFLCRSVSIISSGLSALVLFMLVRSVSRKAVVAWTALIFFLLNPFNFFSDRTSLLEPSLNLFVLITVYLYWLALKHKRPWQLWAAMGFLGLAVLTKLTALLIVPGLIFLAIFHKPKRPNYLLALILSTGIMMWLLTSFTGLWSLVGYHAHSGFNLASMAGRAKTNFHITTSWYKQYLSSGFFVLSILGTWQLIKSKKLYWLVFPLSILASYILLADSYFPRFLLLTLPFWALIIGYSTLTRIGLIIFMVTMAIFVVNDYKILTNPSEANLAKEDHFQFFQDWTSGVGFLPTLEYLADRGAATIVMPQDLEFRFRLYSQTGFEDLALEILPVTNSSDLKLISEVLQKPKTLVITTTHHSWLVSELSETYLLTPVFASDEDRSSSLMVYQLTSKF